MLDQLYAITAIFQTNERGGKKKREKENKNAGETEVASCPSGTDRTTGTVRISRELLYEHEQCAPPSFFFLPFLSFLLDDQLLAI